MNIIKNKSKSRKLKHMQMGIQKQNQNEYQKEQNTQHQSQQLSDNKNFVEKDELGRLSIFSRIEKKNKAKEQVSQEQQQQQVIQHNSFPWKKQQVQKQKQKIQGENPRKKIRLNDRFDGLKQQNAKNLQQQNLNASQNQGKNEQSQDIQEIKPISASQSQNVLFQQQQQPKGQVIQNASYQQSHPPLMKCANGPNCQFGSNCKFYHAPAETPCRYGQTCQRKDCAFQHKFPKKVINKTWVNPDSMRPASE